jgi:hypothetical protein
LPQVLVKSSEVFSVKMTSALIFFISDASSSSLPTSASVATRNAMSAGNGNKFGGSSAVSNPLLFE